MAWLKEFPSLGSDALGEIRRTVDGAFRGFTREHGEMIERLFDPLRDFLLASERLLTQSPWPLVIGAIAGVLCQEAVLLVKNRVKIDDTLDVFAVHGVGGIFGTVMIAVFGHGSWSAQLGGLAVVGLWTVAASLAIIKLVARITPIRVDQEAEVNGLDMSSHGERAYELNS